MKYLEYVGHKDDRIIFQCKKCNKVIIIPIDFKKYKELIGDDITKILESLPKSIQELNCKDCLDIEDNNVSTTNLKEIDDDFDYTLYGTSEMYDYDFVDFETIEKKALNEKKEIKL